MNRLKLFLITPIFCIQFSNAQRIDKEIISFQLLKEPVFATELASRNYKITVQSPYNITKDDVLRQSKEDYQRQVDNYQTNVESAKLEHTERLKDYDAEVKKLQEKYKLESAEYSKLSAVEKIAATNGAPVLRIPSRPVLNIPPVPVYRQPDLKDALIVDNKILASQMDILGFSKGGNYLDVTIEMERTNFQDNQGKTFANQPTRIIGKQNGTIKLDKTYFSDFAEVASVPTNEINLNAQEKRFLQRTMDRTRNILNDNFGYQTINSTVTLASVKNKGEYDDLEKAYIYVTTNLKKLQAKSDYAPNKVAMENMQKGIDIWKNSLTKVNYQDKKAVYNQKIGEYLYFNLIRLQVALGNYQEAEKYLNELQEHLVDIKLSYDANLELKRLEEKIYNN
ncbi:hypothetical protein C1637_12925 [Chryseobacterium lactis]|uniref:Tetratricopeptide repeat protein n=1 Tax=Chryseobacterium lactis TaxID=1241981 RepID=A0A3G6RKV3_CHRLC|nr:hypothetical protein [Chryseobacterium lactis]AZA80580.1 hypothetical protein EG342_01015 [Chryseobacterium lactis]AZB05582.1 hypothetical protein EG341_17140 [Chryseobacterium lactis]PNW13699.1 hypothetical protein C1637_12925 [Chryseobacterium lactis]